MILNSAEAKKLLSMAQQMPAEAVDFQRGKKASGEGALAEQEVDLSLSRYQADRMAYGVPTYPKVLVVGFNKRKKVFEVRFTEHGAPDRAVAITRLGGRLCWLEVKTWEAENKHTLTKRLHQFYQMKESIYSGGALGFYLVKWRTKAGDDWRLYPVQELVEGEGRIVFRREKGVAVETGRGYPDWLPVVYDGARTVRITAAGETGVRW